MSVPTLPVPVQCLLIASAVLGAASPAAAQVRKLNGLLAPLPDAEGAARVFDWKFSPDGTRVFYLADPATGGAPRLYGAPADGSALATRLSTRRVGQFQLGPDGARVAFTDWGTSALYVMPSDGSVPPIRVASTTEHFEFTPDGTRLVTNGTDLRVVPVDGSAPLVLHSRVNSFQVGPDGSQILFVVPDDAPGGFLDVLWRMALDGGSAPVAVSEPLASIEYRFSPDGTRAVFASRDFYFSASQLFSVRLDGSSETTQVASSVTRFAISRDSTRIVFTGTGAGGQNELFSAPIEGGPIDRLSGDLVAGGNVEGVTGGVSFEITADSRHVVYRADQELDGVYSLYSVPLHGRGAARRIEQTGVGRFALGADGGRVVFEARDAADQPMQLFGAPIRLPLHRRAELLPTAAVRLSGPMPARGGLVDFDLGSDARSVVYTARQESLAVELYHVPIDGASAPLKLNPPLVENGDVDGLIRPAFQVDPTARRVVYRADQEIDEAHELFSVAIEGGPARRLNAPLPRGPTKGTVLGFSFVPGGRDVLFQAAGDRDGVFELYRVPLAGGADERLNTPLEPGGYVVPEPATSADGRWVVFQTFALVQGSELYSFDLTRRGAPIPLSEDLPGSSYFQFFLTPDAARVVFEATSPASKREVYSRRIDGSAPVVQLSAVHAGNGDGALRLSPDGSRAVYQGNHESIANRELFSAPVDGSRPPVRVSGVLPIWGSVVESSTSLETFQVGPSSRWAVFLADRDQNDQVELYGAPVDGGRAPVQLSGTLPLLGDVKRFAISPTGIRAVYVADQDRNDRDELYSVPLFGAPSARSTQGGARIASVKLNGPIANRESIGSFQISPLGDFVVYVARQLDDADRSIFSVAIDGSSPPRRLGASSATWRFTPDGRRLVYCAGQDSPYVIELYSVPLDGSQPAVKLNAPLPRGGNVVQYGLRGEPAFEIGPDGRTVVYLADQRLDERFEIFAVDVEGHAPPVVVNAPLGSGRDVGGPNLWSPAFRITPDGREVVYLADHDEDEITELYAAPLP